MPMFVIYLYKLYSFLLFRNTSHDMTIRILIYHYLSVAYIAFAFVVFDD